MWWDPWNLASNREIAKRRPGVLGDAALSRKRRRSPLAISRFFPV
jgi:hypothetical protein